MENEVRITEAKQGNKDKISTNSSYERVNLIRKHFWCAHYIVIYICVCV